MLLTGLCNPKALTPLTGSGDLHAGKKRKNNSSPELMMLISWL